MPATRYDHIREDLHPKFQGSTNALSTFSQGMVPRKRKEMFDLGQHLWYNMGRVSQGLRKVAAYHMTEAEVTGDTRKRNDAWEELLNEKLDLLNILIRLSIDYLIYGNSISSLVFPIRRYLVCPHDDCGIVVRAERIDFEVRDGYFYAKCPGCKRQGRMHVHDRKDYTSDNINVMRWRLHDIYTEHARASDSYTYLWRPDAEWKQDVRVNNRTVLCNDPLSMIRAASRDNLLKLNNDLLHHIRYDAPCGLLTGGWGIPPILNAIPDAYLFQLFRIFQEGVSLDYLWRIRILTPMTREKAPDTGYDQFRSLGDEGMPMAASKIREIIQRSRRDPLKYHVAPFPIQEGTINGDGIDMLRPDLMTWMGDEIMHTLGVPVEFAHSNLEFRPSPHAVRAMEKEWEHLSSALNSWLGWMTSVIARARGWWNVTAKLKPPSMFADPVRKQIMLQLAAAGQLDKKTAFKEFGLDIEQIEKNLDAERQDEMKKQKEMQANEATSVPNLAMLAGQGLGGPVGMPGGGAPMPGGGGGMGGMMPQTAGGSMPRTLNDMKSTARQIAVNLFGRPEVAERVIRDLGHQNRELHALVKSYLNDMRQSRDQQAAMQAQQAMQAGF